jgi:cytochrome c551/c552
MRAFGGKGAGSLNENEAADLFAYFSSRRYFERPGDAKRGKRVFKVKQCGDCHGIEERVAANAPPVVAWSGLRDPIGLAQQMWNRRAGIRQAFARIGVECPQLDPQELTDLLVYLENLPAIRGQQPRFQLVPATTGRTLLETRGCGRCHHGTLPLENGAPPRTFTDFSAALWNHPPGGAEVCPRLNYEEMGGIVSYLLSTETAGDPRRGRLLFARKKCVACHSAASLTAISRELGPAPLGLMTALWNHQPAMAALLAAGHGPHRGLPGERQILPMDRNGPATGRQCG